jgi:uncharacterized protein (TIGR00288 family)
MRAPVAPIHRGPQAILNNSPFQHAPNAALLIDFDNVTMGIRSDLAGELRNLLGSEIIKGKVAVQRAYADWRRYPQYIVPLAESSIDMIMAPAYGSSKKNATDIRLSVDAMELVFTRPEIGTYILLSGDSDFASLVTKLKEYGKYVIGVGIRESSSDLLVMNCDEYYSYNALAGLVKSGDEETVKWDPWELVVEAITRMVKNGDVMRSDRLKQVMQDIDTTFDEKNLGMSKFSRFVQDAATRGLISITKLENGQLEVGMLAGRRPAPAAATTDGAARTAAPAVTGERTEEVTRPEGSERGGRRGRRGRGRDRDRDREPRLEGTTPAPAAAPAATPLPPIAPASSPAVSVAAGGMAGEPAVGHTGERLTKDEAFDIVRRAARAMITGESAVMANTLRKRAHELLGRDSESLNERMFIRILKDAHDAEIIDLRRRGDDYEVALPAEVAPVSEQLNRAAQAHASAQSAATPASPVLRGMGPRGIPSRGGRGLGRGAPPPELLALGVVEEPAAPVAVTSEPVAAPAGEATEEAPARKPRGPRGGARPAKKGKPATGTSEKAGAAPAAASPSAATRPAAKKSRGPRGAAKKAVAKTASA